MAIPKNDKNKKRTWQPRLPTCKYCGAFGKHYSYQCRLKPQKVTIKPESKKSRQKRLKTATEWFELNPPNEKGLWECYLKISPLCPTFINKADLNLEHVKPRSRHPELKYEVSNIQPACQPCNKLKASWSLEELAETYPQIKSLIDGSSENTQP